MLEKVSEANVDLGKRSFAVAVQLKNADSAGTWFVTVHLDAFDAALRASQMQNLNAWVAELGGPVVIGGDFSTEGRVVTDLADARTRVPTVGHKTLASRHGKLRKRRKAPWVDRILTTADVEPKWVTMVLTDEQESDHHFPVAGVIVP